MASSSHACSSKRPILQSSSYLYRDILRRARNAYDLSLSRPEIALLLIQELCSKYGDIGVLFRTQAAILDKCYQECKDPHKKRLLMGEAIKSASKSIILSPNSMDFSAYLGHLYCRAEEYTMALEQFNCALTIPSPSDPVQETILTEHEIKSRFQSYEERIEDGRKCILNQMGYCLYRLKQVKAFSIIRKFLQAVKVNNLKERFQLFQYFLNDPNERLQLKKYLRSSSNVHNVAIEEVRRPLKMKESIVYHQARLGGTQSRRELGNVSYNPIEFEKALLLSFGTEQDELEAQVLGNRPTRNAGDPRIAEYYIGMGQNAEHFVVIENLEELLQSRRNLVILTGQKVLKPDCFINHIILFKEKEDWVLRRGPMALVLVAETEVQTTISQFPNDCKASGLCTWHMIGCDVVVGTPSALETLLISNPEAEENFCDVRFVVISNTGGGGIFLKAMFRKMDSVQVVFVNSVDLCEVFSTPFTILDFKENAIQ